MRLFKKEESPEMLKLKDLTGGFLISNEFQERLESNNLEGSIGYTIQRILKNEIKEGKLKVDDIELRLQYLLENDFQSEKEEKQKKELEKQEKKEKKELEEKEKIRKGVGCKIPKPVIANNGHDGLTKGVATLAFGITGWALTSGSQTEAQMVEVDAIIKIVPNGVVITSKHEETMRIPFDQIISARITGGWLFKNFMISIVGSKTVYIKDCQYGETIVNSINESATGAEEEGWV